jgi:hypothetical protein
MRAGGEEALRCRCSCSCRGDEDADEARRRVADEVKIKGSEQNRTSRTGEKLVWLDCGSGEVVVGEIHGFVLVWPTAALLACRPAVLASLTWFGRG